MAIWTGKKVRVGLGAGLLASAIAAGTAAAATKSADFDMVVSGGAKACLPKASGEVHIRSVGPVEIMDVNVDGLPPKTDFDFFVIQVPKAPFGISWYQGDIETNGNGHGHQRFIGRFSIETFAVAPGSAPAPVVFTPHQVDDEGLSIGDASSNPKFDPIQMYHLGLWFNSPVDAENAGCPDAVTPFNGTHDAGIQVLNTSNFADDQGPLRQIQP